MITALAAWLDGLVSIKTVKITTTVTRYYPRYEPHESPVQKESRVVYDTDPTHTNAPCDRPSAK